VSSHKSFGSNRGHWFATEQLDQSGPLNRLVENTVLGGCFPLEQLWIFLALSRKAAGVRKVYSPPKNSSGSFKTFLSWLLVENLRKLFSKKSSASF
jgi:hypothetical protein